MRRFLLAAALALAFHGLLFTMKFEGPGAKPILPPKPLTLSLDRAPREPLPSLPAPKTLEPQESPPQSPQVRQETPRPQKSPRPEKASKRIAPSAIPRQEPPAPSPEDRGWVAEEIPAPGAPRESPSSTQAALEGGGRDLSRIPVHEATPLYRENPVPEYPSIARRRGFHGTVVLEVLVTREGKVRELTLSASSGYWILDQAAMATVKTWLFDPGTRGGEKVDMWVKVPVRFRLE